MIQVEKTSKNSRTKFFKKTIAKNVTFND